MFRQCQIRHQGSELPVSYFIRPGLAGTLVLLHGLGGSKQDYLAAVGQRALSDYALVAFDFPGCGGTPYPKDARLGVDDLVEITDQVVSALNINDFVIIGHSMGGLVGLLFAGKYGSKLEGFVDVEGNLSPEDCFLTRGIAGLSFDDFLNTEQLETLKLKFVSAPHRATRMWAEDLDKQVPRAIYDYAVSIVNWSDNEDLLTGFLSLPIPRLFVYGSANSQLSYIPRLKLSGAGVVEIPDSGHWPHLDNPVSFYSEVARFLLSDTTPPAFPE